MIHGHQRRQLFMLSFLLLISIINPKIILSQESENPHTKYDHSSDFTELLKQAFPQENYSLSQNASRQIDSLQNLLNAHPSINLQYKPNREKKYSSYQHYQNFMQDIRALMDLKNSRGTKKKELKYRIDSLQSLIESNPYYISKYSNAKKNSQFKLEKKIENYQLYVHGRKINLNGIHVHIKHDTLITKITTIDIQAAANRFFKIDLDLSLSEVFPRGLYTTDKSVKSKMETFVTKLNNHPDYSFSRGMVRRLKDNTIYNSRPRKDNSLKKHKLQLNYKNVATNDYSFYIDVKNDSILIDLNDSFSFDFEQHWNHIMKDPLIKDFFNSTYIKKQIWKPDTRRKEYLVGLKNGGGVPLNDFIDLKADTLELKNPQKLNSRNETSYRFYISEITKDGYSQDVKTIKWEDIKNKKSLKIDCSDLKNAWYFINLSTSVKGHGGYSDLHKFLRIGK